MAANVQNVKFFRLKILDYAKLWIFITNTEVCMNLDIISRPVSELLGCSLVNFPSICPRLSVELDPQTGV